MVVRSQPGSASASRIRVTLATTWYEQNHPTYGVWGEIYTSGQIRIGSW